MISAFLVVFNGLLNLIQLALLIWIIVSWLVALDVLNLRNRIVYQVSSALDRLFEPMLAPIRRFIPPLGAIDISPIIFLLLLKGLQVLVNNVLLGNIFG